MFSTLKNSPFPSAQSIKLHIRALDLIPCLIPRHRCEKSARESRSSHHLITQRDNIHARAPDMCVDPRGYMSSCWRNLSVFRPPACLVREAVNSRNFLFNFFASCVTLFGKSAEQWLRLSQSSARPKRSLISDIKAVLPRKI